MRVFGGGGNECEVCMHRAKERMEGEGNEGGVCVHRMFACTECLLACRSGGYSKSAVFADRILTIS